ncbi:uncharacterized protein TrAtP1_000431 [Trichoderma atroviride]|uniref:uncharacterized protein n=1 Tax=Hypocrea atroviridis TaxID=63577 RepID=UPI0033185BD6|nr:hypothetical protein TrAtP1_000431 [Trichoderma atroviride]
MAIDNYRPNLIYIPTDVPYKWNQNAEKQPTPTEAQKVPPPSVNGNPVMDMEHILRCLNRLNAGVHADLPDDTKLAKITIEELKVLNRTAKTLIHYWAAKNGFTDIAAWEEEIKEDKTTYVWFAPEKIGLPEMSVVFPPVRGRTPRESNSSCLFWPSQEDGSQVYLSLRGTSYTALTHGLRLSSKINIPVDTVIKATV